MARYSRKEGKSSEQGSDNDARCQSHSEEVNPPTIIGVSRGRRSRENELQNQVCALRQQLHDLKSCQEDAYTVSKVQKLSREKLFPQIKWIFEHVLDDGEENGTVASYVMCELNVPFEEKKPFWRTYKPQVNIALTEQQSNVTMSIKRSVLGEMDCILTLCFFCNNQLTSYVVLLCVCYRCIVKGYTSRTGRHSPAWQP